jgi:hypothetical protein
MLTYKTTLRHEKCSSMCPPKKNNRHLEAAQNRLYKQKFLKALKYSELIYERKNGGVWSANL